MNRLASAAIIIIVFVASLRLFEVVWHRPAFADIVRQPGQWVGAVIIVIGSAIIHELLHGLAWKILARVPWRSISFRPSWRKLGFVAAADVPMRASAYRTGMLLPALVLGFGSIVAGLMIGNGLVLLWGLFFLLECFADFAALLATREVG